MHCVYNISVPHGKLQKLVFQVFDLAIDPECRLEPIFHTICWWTLYYWTDNERNYFFFTIFIAVSTKWRIIINDDTWFSSYHFNVHLVSGCLINLKVKCSGYSWAYCYSVPWKKYAPVINTLPKSIDNIITRVVRVSRNKIWRSSANSMQLRFWWSHLERGAI